MASKFFMPIRQLTVLALLLATMSAQAEPAPWYWWVSQVDGSRVCNQTSLGEGWIQEPKPFKDAHCRVPYPTR